MTQYEYLTYTCEQSVTSQESLGAEYHAGLAIPSGGENPHPQLDANTHACEALECYWYFLLGFNAVSTTISWIAALTFREFRAESEQQWLHSPNASTSERPPLPYGRVRNASAIAGSLPSDIRSLQCLQTHFLRNASSNDTTR